MEYIFPITYFILTYIIKECEMNNEINYSSEVQNEEVNEKKFKGKNMLGFLSGIVVALVIGTVVTVVMIDNRRVGLERQESTFTTCIKQFPADTSGGPTIIKACNEAVANIYSR